MNEYKKTVTGECSVESQQYKISSVMSPSMIYDTVGVK